MNVAEHSPELGPDGVERERLVRMTETEAPLRCVHCGGPIAVGEWYLRAGRCGMGGVVTGPHVDLYGDTLEPAGEHPDCATKGAGGSPRG